MGGEDIDDVIAKLDVFRTYERTLDLCMDQQRRILGSLQHQLKILRTLKKILPKLKSHTFAKQSHENDSSSSCVADDEDDGNRLFVCPTTDFGRDVERLMLEVEKSEAE